MNQIDASFHKPFLADVKSLTPGKSFFQEHNGSMVYCWMELDGQIFCIAGDILQVVLPQSSKKQKRAA